MISMSSSVHEVLAGQDLDRVVLEVRVVEEERGLAGLARLRLQRSRRGVRPSRWQARDRRGRVAEAGGAMRVRRARRSSCRAGGTGRATSVKFSEWPTYSRPPGLHHARGCAPARGAASARRNRSSRCGRTRCRTARRATSCASIRLSVRNSISRASSGLTRMQAGVGARAAQEVRAQPLGRQAARVGRRRRRARRWRAPWCRCRWR